MAVTAPDEEIVAAKAYESLHVPALFQQWAPIILDSVNTLAEDQILDVACGTGVLAREAKARCGDSGSVAVWDSLENSEAYPLEVDLLDRRAGREAADALRAPFVLGDKAQLSAMFASAGAASVRVSTRHGTARYPSIRTMVEADLRGWLPVMGVTLAEDLIETILNEAEQVLSRYVTAAGEVEFDSTAHILTALAPLKDADQSALEAAGGAASTLRGLS